LVISFTYAKSAIYRFGKCSGQEGIWVSNRR
jgi:hypothetical protein